jgi:glucose-6-phosphate isomerase
MAKCYSRNLWGKRKMKSFSSLVISGRKKGTLVNSLPILLISELGLWLRASNGSWLCSISNHLQVHFVSNVDGDHVISNQKIRSRDDAFVIVSKTFTTQETLSNSETIKKWF